jgi:hypothetical protein
MECLHRSPGSGAMNTPPAKYDREKIARIREKIAVVFGRASTLDDAAISDRYNITPDGDLIMMIK